MKSMFKTPDWMVKWQEKFEPVLVSGLTDGPTYVRLSVKALPTLYVVLAFRPMADRVTHNDIMLGGKLSVFPLLDTLKVQPSSDETMMQWLRSAYPSIEFPKINEKRAGTIVASVQKAPYESGKAFLAAFKEGDGVDKLLDYIESLTGEPVEERKLAARALKEAFLNLLPPLFDMKTSGGAVEANVTYEDGEKVVSLAQKKALKALVEALAPASEDQPD